MGLLQHWFKWTSINKSKKRNDKILRVIDREFKDIAFRCTGGDFQKAAEFCAFLALLVSEGKVFIKKDPGKEFDPSDMGQYLCNAVMSANIFHEALYSTAITVTSGNSLRASEYMGFISFLFLMQRIQLVQPIKGEPDGQ